ncbi:MAG: hypothetical protein ACE5ID_11710, partial [Acidobacteriota bacterium]
MKRSVLGSVCLLLLLAGGSAGAVLSHPGPPSPDGGEEMFRRIRRAVLKEDEETLYQLAREDPWGFREVSNQLADLAVKNDSDGNADDSAAALVVAGHLAAIYLQTTGDTSLARRVRAMTAWNHQQMHQRALVDDLLSRVESQNPPRVRQLEEALPICRQLGDDRCLGILEGSLGLLRQRRGDGEAAALDYQRAAQAFKKGGELRRLRDAHLARGQLLLESARLQAAAESLGAATAVSEQIGDAQGEVGALFLLSEALSRSQRRERALSALYRARQVSLEAGFDALAARAILMAARLRGGDAPLPGAAADYQAAGRLAAKAHDLDTAFEAYGAAARALAMDGRNNEGLDAVEKALSAARLGDNRAATGGLLLLASELYGRLGDWDRALRRVNTAIALLRTKNDDVALMQALALKGTTLLQA